MDAQEFEIYRRQPTSLFEAAQRGMKMESKVTMAPPKTVKELAKQLVEAKYELPRAQRTLTDAQERLTRVEGEIARAILKLQEVDVEGTRAILVTTQVCKKAVTLRSDGKDGVTVEVLDLEHE